MTRRKMNVLILVAGLLALAGAYYAFLVSPALSHHARLERSASRKVEDLETMRQQRAEWLAFTATRRQAETLLTKRGGDFSLLSFMEGITRKVGVGDRISYMKPLSFSGLDQGPQTPVGIEIQLDGLHMSNLVRLLYEIEYSGKLLRIHRIKIKANADGKERSLKVTLQVQTYTQGA